MPTEVVVSPTGTYPISGTRAEDERLVRTWGFDHVFTWTDGPNARYSPHTHRGLTTHLIRSGEMIVTYPGDDSMQKQRFGVGARIDVPAGKLHEVTMGKDGCSYVIGE